MAEQFKGSRTVLTGASSGIGLALANQLHAAGAELIAYGRRTADDLPPGFPDVAYHTADLADAGTAGLIVSAIGERRWEGLDLVILNAATGAYRPADAETADTIAATVAVNLAAPVAIVHALADLLADARGRVVFVGSTAHRGAAGFPVYAATKGALAGFARALRSEWQGRIAVQIVHPGPTATAMHARAGFDPGPAGKMFLSPDAVASMILAAARTNRSPITAGYAGALLRRRQ